MKRYRHVGLRKPRHYYPCDPAYYLDGFPGRALMTSGFMFRCPACLDPIPAVACATCGGTGSLPLDDKRIHRSAVAA